MKKDVLRVSVLVVVVGMLGFAPCAMALSVLEDGGQKVVHDEVNDLYWYWDVYHWWGQDYFIQKALIATELAGGYFGVTGWHMANADDYAVWLSYGHDELVDTFGLQYARPNGYCTEGRFDLPDGGFKNVAWGFSATAIYEVLNVFEWTDDIGAWVVADAPVGDVIPEPDTLFLLGAGVLGLLALRRKYHHQP